MQTDNRHPIEERQEARQSAACPPRPLRVGIVGLGAIGATIGLGLLAAGAECLGYDSNPEHTRKALRRRAVSRTVARLADLADCKVVFLCVPPGRVLEVASTLRRESEATFIDVASAKSYLASVVRDPSFVLSHPMKGSNLSGPGAAKDGLFLGATWVITPLSGTSLESLRIADELIRRMGAIPVSMDPATHDRICARISHLPHVVSSALVLTALSQESVEAHLLAGASFNDVTRVAGGNPLLWRDVAMTNKEAIVQVLTDLMTRLEGFVRNLKDGDVAAVETFFCSAAELLEDEPSTKLVEGPAEVDADSSELPPGGRL